MWKRALKPLPTKPMPRRSVLMSFAERVAVSSSIGREALLAPVELRVRHAQFRERGRRAPVPVGRERLPSYLRSFNPNLLDQNPDAVISRKRLKKLTPSAIAGVARSGHAMSLRIAARCDSVASANGFPNLVFDCASIQASPSRIHF